MILMNDIIREGNPILRQEAQPVEFPLSAADRKLAADMMTFLENSQDEALAEKYQLRAGVGLAAPQVAVSKQMSAVLVPSQDPEKPILKTVLINPKIISHSVQNVALSEGEGCLSVDRDVPGYVCRHDKITLRYQDLDGQTQKIRLKGYPAIVCQHEIDHLHGTLFYDHINLENPFNIPENTVILE